MENQLLTTTEAGRLLGVSGQRVLQLVRAGKLRAVRAKPPYLIPAVEVRRYQGVRRGSGRPSRFLSHAGRTLSLRGWAKELGISREGLRYRLRHWPLEEALGKPRQVSVH